MAVDSSNDGILSLADILLATVGTSQTVDEVVTVTTNICLCLVCTASRMTFDFTGLVQPRTMFT